MQASRLCTALTVASWIAATAYDIAADEEAYAATPTSGSKSAEPPIRVVFGDPSVVVMAPPEEKRWGFYQFPSFGQTTEGELVVRCQVADDSHAGAGERHPSPHFVTHDGGKTWKPMEKSARLRHGRMLRNGLEIGSVGRAKRLARELGIRPVHERFRCHYGSQFDLYRYGDLPDDLKGVKTFLRKPDGQVEQFVAPVEAPGILLAAYRRTGTSSGPVELEGHIFPLRFDLNSTRCLELPDGTLLYVCSFIRVDDQGKVMPGQAHSHVLASEDGGRSWKLRAVVPMIPDKAPWGLYEQTLTRLPSGVLVCVMRSEEGGPPTDPRNLWITRSKDGGRTWEEPSVLNHFGVEPELLTLAGGVTAVAYGRPGVELRFCCDPEGKIWSRPYVVHQGTAVARPDTTCGYTKLFSTGPDRFLIVYSDFRHRDKQGTQRKTIKVREVRAIRQ